MLGDTVIADGIKYVIVFDGSLPPRATVIPKARVSTDRLCACGCGQWVSPPCWYASQACAGRAHRGKQTSERCRRTA